MGDTPYEIDFEVLQIWKYPGDGRVNKITINVGAGGGDCTHGPDKYTVGSIHVINTDAGLSPHNCSSVDSSMSVAEVTKVLGKPKKPEKRPGILKRKLQIRYRAARSINRTMKRLIKLAAKFMKRSGKNLKPK